MAWSKLIGLAAGILLVAAASCSEEESPGAGGAAGSAGSGVGTGGQGLTAGSGGSGATGGAGTGGQGGQLECFEFSNDSTPLAIDGTFEASSPTWRRPHDEPEICPATALLPSSAALVPFVEYAFCNNDSVEHTYDFEMLAQDGPSGETPLDDPYLFLYEGRGIPADPLQCLAVNDDIPFSLDATDSEILGITVPAGGAITVVGTTVTFDPSDGTGQGYYVLVVSNAD